MNCAAAREMMLEVDLTELDGTIESELIEHVRACAQCSAAVQRILTAQRALRHALRNAAPRLAPDALIGRAKRHVPLYRRAWPAAALAAAATLGALLLSRPESSVPMLPPTPPPTAGSGLAVQAPPGRSVAVFRTDNPDIVVIWFY
jgi:anti-sigma factor RsiW